MTNPIVLLRRLEDVETIRANLDELRAIAHALDAPEPTDALDALDRIERHLRARDGG